MLQTLKRLIIVGLVSLSSPTFADITQVDNAALEKLQADGAVIIDVRRQDEWELTGLVEGSHALTFFDAHGRYDVEAWLASLDEIVKADQPVVLICQHGVRSSKIASLLDKRLGYSAVHNVTKGIHDWLEENRPVVTYEP